VLENGLSAKVTATAFLSEYKGTSPVWRTKPRVMLSKCAEALALRKAFPVQCSGAYVEEEFDKSENLDTSTGEVLALPKISKEQLEEVEHFFVEDGDESYRTRILDHFKVKKLDDISLNQYPLLKNAFEKRKASKKSNGSKGA
jgi:hypothetical protein